MSDDLAILERMDNPLVISREPEAVLEEAHRAAAAIKRVIDSKPKKVMFGDEQYIEFEDWCCLGRFYGIAPRVPESATRYVEFGAAQGWEAYAEAIHVPTGRVISSASAMCLNDEEKWRARPKYAWVYHKKSGGTSVEDPGRVELIWERNADGKSRPKKSKELIGEEAVPQFQLRSMAQTRAGAKALRNALGWVVVLAGYKATPAEELDVREEPQQPRGVRGAESYPDAGAESPTVVGAPDGRQPQTPHDPIDAQAARLFPPYQPGEPADAAQAQQRDLDLETERSLYLSKLGEWRTKRAVTEARFAELCREEGLTVPGLGQADPATLSNLLNRIIREPKR